MSNQGRDRRRRLATVALVALLVIAADQITKSIAVADLRHGPVHLFGPFSFQLEYNTGVAFSIGVGATVPIIIIAAVVIGGLLWFARSTPSLPAAIGIGLVLGGALGNLADRFFRNGGAVVDFVHSTFWPTFNVADSCITIGCVALALLLVRGPQAVKDKALPSPDEAASGGAAGAPTGTG